MGIKRNTSIENNRKYFTVALDSYERTMMVGRLYHTDLCHPICFHGAVEFVNAVEGVLNAIGYTREVQIRRNLVEASAKAWSVDEEEAQVSDPIMPGKLQTATLRVSYRQNASWQGAITFQDGETEVFKSFLRLMHIMDSHLSSEAIEAHDLYVDIPAILAIDDYDNSCFVGSISQAQYDNDVRFTSAMDLARKVVKKTDMKDFGEIDQVISEKILKLYRKHGKKATFTIKILFTENDSIQGIFTWREAKQQMSFRSFLELMMCADRILETGAPMIAKEQDTKIQVV